VVVDDGGLGGDLVERLAKVSSAAL